MKNGLVFLLVFGFVSILGCATPGKQGETTDLRAIEHRVVSVVPISGETPWDTPEEIGGVPSFDCPYLGNTPPKIDADLSDWKDADWVVLNKAIQYSGQNWTGPEDCSFRIAFAYDPSNLYIAVELTDDVHHQPHTGADIWRGDSFQVAIDPWLDRSKNTFAGDDVEFGWALMPDMSDVQIWRWFGGSTLPSGPMTAEKAFAVDGNTIRYEMAIPFSQLGQFSPGLLRQCGITFLYNDNDGEGRDGYLEWTPGIGSRKDPSSFGIMRFGEAPEGAVPSMVSQINWIKNVTAQGNSIELRLNMLSREDRVGIVTATLIDDAKRTPLGSETFRIPGGQNSYAVRINTSDLPEGRRRMLVVFTAGDIERVETERAVYIYPPIRWVE